MTCGSSGVIAVGKLSTLADSAAILTGDDTTDCATAPTIEGVSITKFDSLDTDEGAPITPPLSLEIDDGGVITGIDSGVNGVAIYPLPSKNVALAPSPIASFSNSTICCPLVGAPEPTKFNETSLLVTCSCCGILFTT